MPSPFQVTNRVFPAIQAILEPPGHVGARMSIEGEPMTVEALYENGVFRPQAPVRIEEHSGVEVLASSTMRQPTGLKDTSNG